MKLVVLNVAHPFARVAPDAFGGPEQTVARLDAELVQSGHESFVMACDGSVIEGILLATPKPSGRLDPAERQRIHAQYRFTLQTFLEKWPIDLIHMHGSDFYEYLPSTGIPVLATLHLSPEQYPESIFRIERPRTFLQCVNESQLAACPPCSNVLPFAGDDSCLALYERIVSEARAADEVLETGLSANALESVHA